MKERKEEKGVTLVALTITIVILIILSVIVINKMQHTQITEYAINTVNIYNLKENEENTILESYYNELKKYGNSMVFFTVKNYSTGEVYKYNFIEGQTWEDYIETCSDFTTNNSGWLYYKSCYLERKGIAINKIDLILNGGEYAIDPDSNWSPLLPY